MNKSAIIIGVKGLNLCLDEKRLLQEKQPLGVILFRRNINNPKQIQRLTNLLDGF